jgi:hypothetical protein
LASVSKPGNISSRQANILKNQVQKGIKAMLKRNRQ